MSNSSYYGFILILGFLLQIESYSRNMYIIIHADKYVIASIEWFSNTADGLSVVPSALRWLSWLFSRAVRELSMLLSCRFSLLPPRSCGKGWKTRGQNRGLGIRQREKEKKREKWCGEPAAGMRMNSGGRVRHERGGGAEAPGPEAETVTLLICKSYHRIYSSASRRV